MSAVWKTIRPAVIVIAVLALLLPASAFAADANDAQSEASLISGGLSGSLNLSVAADEEKEDALVSYKTHVQSYGWQEYVSDGEMSGTEGQSKRLEAIQIKLDESISGGITYRTHVQTYGWEKEWKTDGEKSGTEGEAKRLEAIEIKLTGEAAEKYDVWYRVHCQHIGWMGWAKNGASAGTAGFAYRLEGIEIKLLPKDSKVPGDTSGAYRDSHGDLSGVPDSESQVLYKTHVQTYGWQNYMRDGEMSGTEGQSKRLEGIQIKLGGAIAESGKILYRTHVQSYGWEEDWRSNDEMSGTSGQSKRLEAIQIKLDGDVADKYDVWYRVHCQKIGWMGWAKNGASAGTAGFAYRLEGIEIKLLPKGSEAPGNTSGAYRDSKGDLSGIPDAEANVLYRTYVQGYGWRNIMRDGETAGTTSESKRVEAVNVKLGGAVKATGDITYRGYVQGDDWTDWAKNGEMCGTKDKGLRLEAIEIKLTDDAAEQYDVWYRVYCQKLGWMGWAKNGESAGTTGYGYRIEAMQVQLVAKDGKAPGSTDDAFLEYDADSVA